MYIKHLLVSVLSLTAVAMVGYLLKIKIQYFSRMQISSTTTTIASIEQQS